MEDRNLIAKRDRKFSDAFTAWAKEQGYEGIILEHGNEWGNEIVIFDPKRVRILTDTQDGVTSSKPDPEALVPALRNRTAQQRKDEQRKHFKKRNMLTAHFDQKSEKTNDPLVMVKDFLSSIKNGLGISAFYSGEITPQQENQLAHFTQFADSLSKEFKVKNADYRHLDFVQFLADEQGVLDENTLTGLSVAVYSWILETIFGTQFIKGSITHAVFTAKGRYRCARFCLFQDGHDLTASKFRCFHAESPARILRENSTFRSYYF